MLQFLNTTLTLILARRMYVGLVNDPGELPLGLKIWCLFCFFMAGLNVLNIFDLVPFK